MRAEELTRYDWVQVCHTYTEIPIQMQVNEIYKDVIATTCPWTDPEDGEFYDEALLDEITPIPLTDEILKLNGWRDSEYSNILKLYRKDDVYMELRHDNLAVWLDVAGEMPIDTYADYILPRPEYVHTLQHCLRLVGMNEIANNFKVR